MIYTKWLDSGKPYDVLFFVQRKIDMVDVDNEQAIKEAISDLCTTLRVVDMYIMGKHQAFGIQPAEVLDSMVVPLKPDIMDYRRMFFLERYPELGLGYILGRQYYDTHEDDY